MVASTLSAFDLTSTYVCLDDGGAAATIDVTAEFWTELMAGERRCDGRLVTAFQMSESAAHWEMHPAGDELICLFSGSAVAVLEEADIAREIELQARSACIIPKGVWHRLIVRDPGQALFVTPGKGTQHRPL